MQYQPWTLNKYEILSSRRMLVREGISAAPFQYSERHIQCVWYDSSLRPANLFTAEGEKVIIENAGRWNLEAGPDFLDAVIRMGNTQHIFRGDVEVHINPADWKSHDHAGDPRYRNVIAHVTYFPPTAAFIREHPFMLHIPIQETIQAYPSFSFESIDTATYPYHIITTDIPPCALALREKKLKSLDLLLTTAGFSRLRLKARRIQDKLLKASDEQVFYEEIMRALGYKNNRGPFLLLAKRVPIEELRSECPDPESAYALLLGVAGLLPEPDVGATEENRVYIRSLWDRWWKMDEKWKQRIMDKDEWCVSGQRPQNFPERRLAAAAALFSGETRLDSFVLSLDCAEPGLWYRMVQDILRLKARMPFWVHQLTFSGKPTDNPGALIGPRRSAAIITNVMIPFLMSQQLCTAELAEQLPAESDNSIIRHAAHTLLGNDHNPALYSKGLKQQGLIQIFKDFCLSAKKGCRECKLAAALRVECGLLSNLNQRWFIGKE